MGGISRRFVIIGLLLTGIVVIGVAADELGNLDTPDQSEVKFLGDQGDVKGVVTVQVASTWRERYVGLSDTESLGPNEGMLFVHDEEDSYAYVMRDMDFPIDIVFVNASKRVTIIHHAEVEEPPLTRYRGQGKWVVEVPYRWTTDHNVSVGDRVQFVWR